MSLKVSPQQQPSVNIWAPSTCKLIKDQSYTLHCPQAIKVQPKVRFLNHSLWVLSRLIKLLFISFSLLWTVWRHWHFGFLESRCWPGVWTKLLSDVWDSTADKHRRSDFDCQRPKREGGVGAWCWSERWGLHLPASSLYLMVATTVKNRLEQQLLINPLFLYYDSASDHNLVCCYPAVHFFSHF